MHEMLSPVFENFHFNPRGAVELNGMLSSLVILFGTEEGGRQND